MSGRSNFAEDGIKDIFTIIIINVRANNGVFTVKVAKMAGFQELVVAIESDPITAEYFKEKCGLNELDNVVISQR